MIVYVETSHGITVSVSPFFIEERSDLVNRTFFFAYFIRIENASAGPVKLLWRQWHIHDEAGEDYDVEGEGVVGMQPQIASGGVHQYNSFCILKSFEGTMEGRYIMQRDDGSMFEAIIPKFHLRARSN